MSNQYQIEDFNHWKIATIDQIYEQEKDRIDFQLSKLNLFTTPETIKSKYMTSKSFGIFNAFGFLRSKQSISNATQITRNPGNIANSRI